MVKQNKTTNKTAKRNNSKCPTEKWLTSNRTPTKTVHLTLQRTSEGYTIENATILRKLNQHRSVTVPADIRAIINDLNNKGLRNS